MELNVLVQNIEEMRLSEGIDDVELRQEIRTMKIGDCVRLTLLTPYKPHGTETVLVRVTKIDGGKYHGELVTRPTSKGLNILPADLALQFKRQHIHSLQKPGEDHAPPR